VVGSASNTNVTSIAFTTVGLTNLKLSFSHICKVQIFDTARVEFSLDSGYTWATLPPSAYGGTSTSYASDKRFASNSYTNWLPNDNQAQPNASWWKQETFNLSSIAIGHPYVKIRFLLKDGSAFPGANGNYGWVIDDVRVTGASSEINPPLITFTNPIYENYIFNNNGPYSITTNITDASGVQSAKLFYKVNSGVFNSVNMNNAGANLWQGNIPAVNTGDTINYYVIATDNTVVNNSGRAPANGYKQFITVQTTASGVYEAPFLDNFESSLGWTANPTLASSVVSAWEYGKPNYNVTNTSYSGINCWDVNRSLPYTNNAFAVLTSPPFDFSNLYNAQLSFYLNYKTFDSKDGLRVEFSKDNGVNWQVLGENGEPQWYNTAIIGNTNLPGFTGNSNGWKYFKHELSALNLYSSDYVRFRFVFTSDGASVSAGFSMDDFGITYDLNADLKMDTIISPFYVCSGIGSNLIKGIIQNNGTKAVKDSVEVAYRMDNNTAVVEKFNLNLSAGQSSIIEFQTPLIIPSGNHQLRVYSLYEPDTIYTNDQAEITFAGKPLASLSYQNGFENINSINDFCINNGSNAQAVITTSTLINGNKSLLLEAINTNSWDNTNPDTLENSIDYIWDESVNNNNFSSARLFVDTKKYNKLYLQFKLKQVALNNPNETFFRLIINGEQVGPVCQPNTDNTSFYSFLYNLKNFLPNNFITIEFQSKTRGSLNNDGTGNILDDILIYGIDSTLSPGSGPNAPGSTDIAVSTTNIIASNWPTEGESASVKVDLKNVGESPIDIIVAKYLLNGVKVDSFSTFNQIKADSIKSFSFNLPFNLVKGKNKISVITNINGDLNKFNDTAFYEIYAYSYFGLPYINNFDSTDGDFLNRSVANTQWQWGEPNFGYTDSARSGTKAWDIELNNGYSNKAKAYLYSPIFNFSASKNTTLTFYQNRKIEPNIDAFHMEYSTDGQTWQLLGLKGDPKAFNWYTLDSVATTQIDGWSGQTERFIKCSIRMPQLNNLSKTQFRFVFSSNDSITSDGVTVDDFAVFTPNAIDVGVSRIFNPINSVIDPSKAYLKVQLRNYGQDTIYSIPVSYKINGGQSITETWTGTLLPFTVTNHTFINPYNLPGGDYEICSFSSLSGDLDLSNDSLCNPFYGVPVLAPIHSNNFEDTAYVNWITTSNIWEFGTPNSTNAIINAAYSGNNCWKTKLSGNYPASITDYLYTPYFNLSCSDSVILSFMHRFDTEQNVDGGRIEYTVNSGITWEILDTTASSNWYNSTNLSTMGTKGWSGNSNGWKEVSVALKRFERKPELIRFRFRFSSNASNNKNGWAIDDFKVSAREVYNIALNDYDFNNKINYNGNLVSFALTGKSLAPMEIDTLYLNYSIDGGIVNETYVLNQAIGCNQNFSYNFATPYTAIAGNHQVIMWSRTPDNHIDNDLSNDTLKFTFTTKNNSEITDLIPFGSSYCNNFEQGNIGWLIADAFNFNNNLSFSWINGTPIKSEINGSKSGVKCMTTGISGNYNNNLNISLISPAFVFDTNLCYSISFWHNYNIEQLYDGGTFEISSNNGQNWDILGNVFEENWMNAPRISSYENKAGWTGNSNGWVYAYYKLKPISANPSNFRFTLNSNSSNTLEGWAIDDFCIEKLNSCTVGLNENTKEEFVIKVYPNPTSNKTNIVFNLINNNDIAVLELYDVLGKRIYTLQSIRIDSGLQTFEIDLKNNNSGIYQYVLFANGKTICGRIIKE
jgi:hypothetical protein